MPAANNDLCLIIQRMLIDHVAAASNPAQSAARSRRGFLQALRSDANTLNAPEVTSASFSQSSKNVSLRLRYWTSQDRNSATGTPTDPCVTGALKTPLSLDYTISGYAEKKCSYTYNQFRDYCEGMSQRMSVDILDQMHVVEQKMNQDLGADLLAAGVLPYAEDLVLTGTTVDSNAAPKSLKMFEDFATRQISPVGEDELRNEFSLADFFGTPIVVGRGKLWNYAQAAEIACCNDAGQDLGSLDSLMFFEDLDLGTTLSNPDAFYAWQPGNVQGLFQNRYLGEFAYRKNEYEFDGTMMNPLSGIRHDVRVRVNDCGGDVTVTVLVSNNYGLFTIPSDAYPAGDPLSGYRGAVRFIAV